MYSVRWLMKFPASIVLLGAYLLASTVSAQGAFSEVLLDAPGPSGPLKGTLLSPRSKPAAVVLIVPGSGPTDRDGNNPLGVNASTYRLLAEGLASKGIATLRIDKRGMFASVAAVKDANTVTIADYVNDLRSWVVVLRRQVLTSCVWVLGHSEGGLVALASAQEQGVCGLILVATASRPMGEVLRGQLKSNPANAPLLGQALPAIDSLEQGRQVDTKDMHPALQKLFNPAVQGFLISAFSYNPLPLVAAIAKPVLILQGQRDLQIEEGDAKRLKEANPQASLILLPDTNHVLKSVISDDRKINIASYADPTLPLAPYVVNSIEEFLAHNPPH